MYHPLNLNNDWKLANVKELKLRDFFDSFTSFISLHGLICLISFQLSQLQQERNMYVGFFGASYEPRRGLLNFKSIKPVTVELTFNVFSFEVHNIVA